MKTLIIYSSKYGCVKDCSEYLQEQINDEVQIIDINKVTDGLDLEQFDNIIIGSSVYIGKVNKKILQFCEKNLEILLKKRVGIFLCCALAEQLEEYLNSGFPKQLLNSAISIKVFGSEARLDKMSFLDKTVIKAVTKGDFSKFKLSQEEMNLFVKEITKM